MCLSCCSPPRKICCVQSLEVCYSLRLQMGLSIHCGALANQAKKQTRWVDSVLHCTDPRFYSRRTSTFYQILRQGKMPITEIATRGTMDTSVSRMLSHLPTIPRYNRTKCIHPTPTVTLLYIRSITSGSVGRQRRVTS